MTFGYLLVYSLPKDERFSVVTEPFATRFEALSRLDELLKTNPHLVSVEVIRRS
jgi:hypothetical protein